MAGDSPFGLRMERERNKPRRSAAFLSGLIDTIPMMVSAAPLGIVFGAVAVSARLTMPLRPRRFEESKRRMRPPTW